ncbi:DEAD-domain-containing protein [Microthyrium microscopicum]|uniref:RNA helicase n=1 Tax=Microthyrium microscopicum TaxID=703497 RepID=A0A6A6U6N8_9PEZI|nr:DEAD-domain-containing protein [Microthyrium microscopicum]
MKRKRPSPPVSEADFDISGAITGLQVDQEDNSDFDFEQPIVSSTQNGAGLQGEDSGDDSDAAFIAAQQAASNRKATNLKGRTVKKGGAFQAMGLNAGLLKAITRKGFSVPTPIQRKTIPIIMDGSDVVGMARTGSGKTAAFVIPMIERLKSHSAKVGARAIVLSPSRELALQTLKVVKEMSRATELRCVLLVGGDSLEDQFSAMTSNPDILIATPGRFLHLKVEMRLDLSSIEYIVFDEADRLFEMGFAVQLTEILHGLPTSRQTLLFSATLPRSLVEFARAGLQEPKLVRLDAESKVSPDLENAFFLVKSAEKEGALLQVLQDVIQIPLSLDKPQPDVAEDEIKRRKRRKVISKSGHLDSPTQYSTIVFAATKHHVEYLTAFLRLAGYAVSYAYGSLDQTARKMQVQAFRDGVSNILVVTDVAARGIDIPVLANVINFDFPSQPKIFVHRVGRTARAGQKGWSYSLVQDGDLPYLIDLQLFLSRRLVVGRSTDLVNYAEDIVLGTLPQDRLGSNCEWLAKLIDENVDIDSLKSVAVKGEKLYTKSKNSASAQSVKRAKEIQAHPSIGEVSSLFTTEEGEVSAGRDSLLARLRNYRPQETVFEIGKRGTGDETVELLRKTRTKIEQRKINADAANENTLHAVAEGSPEISPDMDLPVPNMLEAMDSASEDELEVTFPGANRRDRNSLPDQDSEFFMSYTPRFSNIAEDRAYGVQTGSSSNARGSNFLLDAKDATMDLANDESRGFADASRPKMRWDKKGKKYVNTVNDEDGSRGAKYVRGESGLKIAASLRSGRFDAWKKTNRLERMPRVGEKETAAQRSSANSRPGKTYRHKGEKAPKEADKYRENYLTQKKRVTEAKENRIGQFKDGMGKNELRSVNDVRKDRKLKERRQARNGRPSAKRGKR